MYWMIREQSVGRGECRKGSQAGPQPLQGRAACVHWLYLYKRGCRCRVRSTDRRQCRQQGCCRCTCQPCRCPSGCRRCHHCRAWCPPGGRHIQNTAHHQGLHQGGVAHPSLQYAPFTRHITRVSKRHAAVFSKRTDCISGVAHPSSWSPSGCSRGA